MSALLEPIVSTWKRARNVLLALLIIVLAQGFGFAVACHGTGEPPRDPAFVQHENEIKAKVSYLTELAECTVKSTSLAASEDCEARVDEKWHVAEKLWAAEPHDGGAK